MRGQEIIVTADPHGTFMEGTIDDTSKPGMLVEMTPATAFTGGRPHFRAVSRTAGSKGPVYVLLPDRDQGKLNTDAYVAGTRCFVYAPVAGEDLNLLVTTGFSNIAIGDLFGVAATGKLLANSSYASAPFQAMEAVTGAAQDTLVWFSYLGNQA